jgi:hypothetical protein
VIQRRKVSGAFAMQGVADGVFPIHGDARARRSTNGFDVPVAIDSFRSCGTDDGS